MLDLLPSLVTWFVVFVFSTTLHEAGHAFAAMRLGDKTAYHGGQVSMNPIPHIQREPFGMVLVPILSFVLMKGQWMFGWASAPYDPRWAMRWPRKAALMALAGPAANLILVVLAGVTIRGLVASGYLEPPYTLSFSQLAQGTEASGSQAAALLLSILFNLNLVLLIFNLLPLPPLDGSGAIQLFLPENAARRYQEFLFGNPLWAWVGIVAAWRLFWPVFEPVQRLVLRLLYPGLVYG
ncbi:MAG TPA: site-2 protease family protein [Thermoanaerobaculia bacterium]|nr:site-2 protease family protein [Thermoanaerobaculia bacterium]